MSAITPNNLLWIVVALVPGFVASRIYSLRCPGVKAEPEKAVLEFLAYSVVNALVWFWVIRYFFETPAEQWASWQVTTAGLLVLFISPTGLALLYAWLRRTVLPGRFNLDHPTPRGWDYFLEYNRQFFILIHLKNGKKIGGYFAGKSYAATFPQEPELYFEQVWLVDEYGGFVEPIEQSAGAVVRQSDWELVEFFNVNNEVTPDVAATVQEGNPGADDPHASSGGCSGTGSTGAVDPAPGEDRPAERWIGNGPAPQPASDQVIGG